MTDLTLNRILRREEPAVIGVRYVALAEIAGFLVLALAIDLAFGSGMRFAELNPHPYWIIVLLMASFYGTNEGLAAALASAIALLAWNLPEQGFDEDRSAWLLRISTTPVLWIVAAIVLGEIRSSLQQRLDGMAEDLRSVRRQIEVITDSHDRLSMAKTDLEARVAGQARTVQTLYRASRSIHCETAADVLAGVPGLVRIVMTPLKFSLYLREDGRRLVAHTREGWSADEAFRSSFEAGTPLYDAIVGQKRSLVISNASDEAILKDEGVVAGPIVDPETGDVIGMIKVEETGFMSLNPSTFHDFRVVCEWIGSAYCQARRVERNASRTPADLARPLMGPDAFDNHHALLSHLANTLGIEASVIYLNVIPAPEDGGADEATVAAALARATEQSLALPKLRFDYRRAGWAYAVLLPGAELDEAETVATRLSRDISTYLAEAGHFGRPRFSIAAMRVPGQPERLLAGVPR
jgi:polysaccharide biosynthesis protein PelD